MTHQLRLVHVISTHAPPEGSDLDRLGKLAEAIDFNPRSP